MPTLPSLGRLSLRRLFRRPEPIDDADGLQAFLDSRAAFIAQKGIIEFCRVRAGVYWQKLFTEEEFRSALAYSCWLAYAPALALVSEMVEAAMRPAAGIHRPRMAAAVEEAARTAYLAHPVPPGFSAPEWDARFAIVSQRLAEAAGRPALPVRRMPSGLAELIFEALPMHPSIVRNDADYVHNNIRMNLLRAHEDFIAASDLKQLARTLGNSENPNKRSTSGGEIVRP
jgi:hypothetical protein